MRQMVLHMTLYGYACVSTTDQDLTIQEQALRAAGCSVVRSETAIVRRIWIDTISTTTP